MSRVVSSRQPKTQAERRQIAKAKDAGIKVRGKRGKIGLPTSLDDLYKSSGKHGWKQGKRRHQYREGLIEAVIIAIIKT